MGFHRFPKNKIRIAGVVVFNSQEQVLLLEHNGVWDLPKGHVEDGESYLEGALRECREETGLSHRHDLEVFPYHFVNVPSKKLLRFYLGFSDGDVEISDEHDDFAWVSVREATHLLGQDNTFSHVVQMLAIPAQYFI
jgi:8-oxo-dGTP pyrophosphatase MutT (NUDIX family)